MAALAQVPGNGVDLVQHVKVNNYPEVYYVLKYEVEVYSSLL